MKTEKIINNLKELKGSYLVKTPDFKLLGANSYGSLTYQFKNREDTSFGTASVGKVFTAVAILQLVEKGMISLEQTIGELLPIDWNKIDSTFTVKQLLTHQSKLPDYFDEFVMEEYADLWKEIPNYSIRSGEDLLPLFIEKEMSDNEGFSYNNSGYVVLGIIVERVTKTTLEEYMKKHVFGVSGMKNTGYYELDRLPFNSATAYVKENENYYSNIYSIDAKGSGAGGVFTTAEDLEKFWESLFNYQLISKEMVDQMMTSHSVINEIISYGYGVWLRNEDGIHVPYIQGSDPGISAISWYHPSKKAMITLLSNYEDDVWEMSRDIKEILKENN